MTLSLDGLDLRISALEEAVIKLQTLLNNVASTEAVRQIILIKQQEINDLAQEVASLETRLELVYNEVFK